MIDTQPNTRKDPDVYKRLEEVRVGHVAELKYMLRGFIEFPTEDNQDTFSKLCTRYRYLWMRAQGGK